MRSPSPNVLISWEGDTAEQSLRQWWRTTIEGVIMVATAQGGVSGIVVSTKRNLSENHQNHGPSKVQSSASLPLPLEIIRSQQNTSPHIISWHHIWINLSTFLGQKGWEICFFHPSNLLLPAPASDLYKKTTHCLSGTVSPLTCLLQPGGPPDATGCRVDDVVMASEKGMTLPICSRITMYYVYCIDIFNLIPLPVSSNFNLAHILL